MIPHKSARGAAALKSLELYEGVPPAQHKLKKVVPQALRVLRLKPGRKYCTLKRISHEVGWAHKDVVDRLEEKRKVKGAAYFERKVSFACLFGVVRWIGEKEAEMLSTPIVNGDSGISKFGSNN